MKTNIFIYSFVLPACLLLLTLASKPSSAAIPPELLPVITEVADDVVNKTWKTGGQIIKRGGRWYKSYLKNKSSKLSEVVIKPLSGNRATVSFRFYCGYHPPRSRKKNHRYAVEHRVYVNGERIFKEPVAHPSKSGTASLNIKNFVPLERIADAIEYDDKKSRFAFRIETRCTAIKNKYKTHPAYPSVSDFITIQFADALKQVVDHRMRSKPYPSNPAGPSSSRAGNRPSPPPTRSRPGIVLPPVSLKVAKTRKSNKALKCPTRLHFTAELTTHQTGKFSYFFDSNNKKKTTPKSFKTNGSGTKKVYWNRPVNIEEESPAKNWVRINVHSETNRGHGFYKSEKIPFRFRCK